MLIPTLLGNENWKLVASPSDSTLKESEEKSKNASDERAKLSNRKPSENETRRDVKKRFCISQNIIPDTEREIYLALWLVKTLM